MYLKLIAAAAMATTLAAHAADPKPAATAPAKDPKPEVVCTTEATLGSHLPKRTCTTRAARDEQAARDQQRMHDMHGAVRANTTSSR